MKKNHVRDYATAAFRFYACTGSSIKYKKKIYDEAIAQQRRLEGNQGGVSCPTEAAIIHAEDALDAAAAELKDLEAVEKTIAFIERNRDGNNMMKALEMVYMAEPLKNIEWGEISERVHHAEINIPASEKTIYRWLSLAVTTFAKERGLRI